MQEKKIKGIKRHFLVDVMGLLLCIVVHTVMPKRWVVERTIGWMNNGRAWSKHYDNDSATGEAKVLLASVYYLSKRLTHREPEAEIDHSIEARLRQRLEKNSEKIDQLP